MTAGIIILHNYITSIVLIVCDSLSELDVVIHTFQRGKSMVRPSPIWPERTLQVSLQVLTSSYWHQSCTVIQQARTSQQSTNKLHSTLEDDSTIQSTAKHGSSSRQSLSNRQSLSSSRPTSACKHPGSPLPRQSKKHVLHESTSNETAPFKLLIFSPAVYQQGWALYLPTQLFDPRSMHCPMWILLGARGTCLQC